MTAYGESQSCSRAGELQAWRGHRDLEAAAGEQLEGHLEVCPSCRREAEQWLEIVEGLRESPVVAPARHPAGLAALLARLDSPESRSDEGSPSLSTSAEEPPAAAVRRIAPSWIAPPRWSWAAAVLALGLGGGWWFGTGHEAAAPYRTLTEPERLGAPRVRVVFEAEVTQAALLELLQSAHARVIDGPSAYGVWTISAKDPAAVVEVLRSSPLVRFAELQGPLAEPSG